MDVSRDEISGLKVRLPEIEANIMELSEATERNQAALRESNGEIGDQVLVHNGMNFTHTEVIRRIIIRLVKLEQLEVAPANKSSNSESEGSEEEEIIL